MTRPAARRSAQPLLLRRGPRRPLPDPRGHDPRRQRRHLRARGGRAAGPRRRVGLRQERDEPGHHAAAAQAGRPDRRRPGHVRRPGPARACARTSSATMRGRDIAMIFQDPMTSLNPVLTIEEQMVETIQAHRKVDARTDARTRAIELLRDGRDPAAGDAAQGFPHQFSRRHAPARDDRDGPRPRAEADDRRRADDRPRRDDPGPGPRAAPRPDRRVRARRSSSSPTTSASWPA